MKIKQVKAYKLNKGLFHTFEEAAKTQIEEYQIRLYDIIFDKDGVYRKQSAKTMARKAKKVLKDCLKELTEIEKEVDKVTPMEKTP